MSLTEQVAKNIIKHLLDGQDYRIEIVTLIDAEFLQFAIDFFKKIVDAKLKNCDVNLDWYKSEFLSPSLSTDEIAIYSGLNKKTITNMYNSAAREVVIDASNQHYDVLYQAINTLVEQQNEIDLTLTIKFRRVSMELNISESLIVINALAVKRAALRGALWSTAGKRIEKPLMQTLCKLFAVDIKNYAIYSPTLQPKNAVHVEREVDFYLIQGLNKYKCEVKLMGKGNPESADVVIARGSHVFIADKLSDLNKKQLSSLGVEWVELRSDDNCDGGYQKFAQVLENLAISHQKFSGNLESHIDRILSEVFETQNISSSI
ncbi:MAG: CfrBI family restriction endonuclease [Thiotrichaceae bacterium]